MSLITVAWDPDAQILVFGSGSGTGGSGAVSLNATTGNTVGISVNNTSKLTISSTVVAATVPLDMGGNAVTNAADPTNPQDLATKNYVDVAVAAVTAGTLVNPGPIGGGTPNTIVGTGITATVGFTGDALTARASNSPLVLSSTPTNSSGTSAVEVLSNTTLTTSGAVLLELSNHNGQGNVGNAFYGACSGGQSDALCDGMILTASGAIADGQTVVWTGKNTVAAAAATVNLTTIAGVAVGAASGGKVRVAMRGTVYVNAVAGVSGAGTMLGTSGVTAGAVVGLTSTNVGTLLGRSLEATGITVAGKLLCQLALG